MAAISLHNIIWLEATWARRFAGNLLSYYALQNISCLYCSACKTGLDGLLTVKSLIIGRSYQELKTRCVASDLPSQFIISSLNPAGIAYLIRS